MSLFFENFDKIIDAPNGINKARKLVLQLAVQGKLTERWRKENPNVEPASELLKKIKAEKEKLINEGKIKKQKELSPIKAEEKPFKLPESWEWARLGDLIYIKSGDSLTSQDMVQGEIPVFGGNGINGYHNEYNVYKETLVIGRVGYYCGSIHIAPTKAWITDNAFKTIFAEDFLYIHFLALLLKTFDLKQNENATAQPVISGRKIYPIPLSLPPSFEQKQIVEKVDSLMSFLDELEEKRKRREERRIQLNTALLDKLVKSGNEKEFKLNWNRITNSFDKLYSVKENVDKLKQTILQLAVQGKLTEGWRKENPNIEPASELLKKIKAEKEKLIKEGKIKKQSELPPIKEEEKPFELPTGWEYESFGRITINRDFERIPVSKEDRASRKGVYDYYGASGIIDSIDDYIFDKPLLLIGEDGANLINRSTPIAFIAKGKYWVNNHAHVIDGISLDFLNYLGLFINSIDLTPYVTGSAQPKMNQSKMNSIYVKVPPAEEQKQIAKRVNELMSLCDELEEKIKLKSREQEKLVESVLKGIGEGKEISIKEKPKIGATDLHAGILAKVIKIHEDNPEHTDKLTHVKGEKITHVVENKLEFDFERTPQRLAAGPADFTRLNKVEHRAKMKKWFYADKVKGSKRYKYTAGKNIDELIEKTELVLSDKLDDVNRILKLFLKMDYRRAEVVATVYAAWNDLLIDGKNPEDLEIVKDARENWTEEKLRIEEDKFYRSIDWLRRKNLVPEGKGEHTAKAKKK